MEQFESVMSKARESIPACTLTAAEVLSTLKAKNIKTHNPYVRYAVPAVSAALIVALGTTLGLTLSRPTEPTEIRVGFETNAGSGAVSPIQDVRVAYIAPRKAQKDEQAPFTIYAGRYDYRTPEMISAAESSAALEDYNLKTLVDPDSNYELKLYSFDYNANKTTVSVQEAPSLASLPGFGKDGYKVRISGGGCICESDDCSEKLSFEHAPFHCQINVADLQTQFNYVKSAGGIGVSVISITNTTEGIRIGPSAAVFFRIVSNDVTFLTFDEWETDYWNIMWATSWGPEAASNRQILKHRFMTNI